MKDSKDVLKMNQQNKDGGREYVSKESSKSNAHATSLGN